jgi:hypothetical protein
MTILILAAAECNVSYYIRTLADTANLFLFQFIYAYILYQCYKKNYFIM